MIKHLWNPGLLILNLILVLVIKGTFLAPSSHLVALLSDLKVFDKSAIITQTNSFRASIGLAPLTENTTLDIVAAQKLQDMLAHQYFAHVSPQGISPWHWFEVNHYPYSYAGENLAVGFQDAPSTLQAWENSPGHRLNLANTNYQDIGVAVQAANLQGNDGIIVVQEFGATNSSTITPPTVALARPTKTPAPRVKPTPPQVLAPTPANKSVVLSATATSVSNVLNTSLIIYTLLCAAFSLIYFLSKHRRRSLLTVGYHVAIYLLAAFLPLAWTTGLRLIG